jgi:putative GTP pyrophosphokinase
MDDLAWRHYKRKNWSAMMRARMRLRFSDVAIPLALTTALESMPGVCKELLRLPRERVVNAFLETGLPVTIPNAILVANAVGIGAKKLQVLEGPHLTSSIPARLRFLRPARKKAEQVEED